MKSLIALAAVAAVAAIAAPASAQTLADFKPVTYQASIGYTGVQTQGVSLGAINLRASAFFGKYLGVEGEGAFGVNDQNFNSGGVNAKLHLNDEYAGYAVARYPVLPNANVFARVGYGHSELKASADVGAANVSATAGVDSVDYGVGGEYFFDHHNGIRVDYTRFDFQGHNYGSADTWSVGYVRRF